MSECKEKLLVHGRLVPCGHCPDCIRKIKRDWVCRCLLEYHMCKCRALHVSLTFDDLHLKDTSYRQVQLFFKRLRKNYNVKFRYFGSYENGTLTGRPHYHIIFFGLLDEIHSADFAKAWQNGFVKVRVCNENTLPYVVGYVQKKRIDNFDRKFAREMGYRTYNSYNKYNTDSPLRSNFYFMSKGLGLQKEILDKVVKKNPFQLKFTFGQYTYAIPRALSQKIKRLYDLDIYKDLILFREYNRFLCGEPSNYDYLLFSDWWIHNMEFSSKSVGCCLRDDKSLLFSFDEINLPFRFTREPYEEDVYSVL